jgi:hypothetical protein
LAKRDAMLPHRLPIIGGKPDGAHVPDRGVEGQRGLDFVDAGTEREAQDVARCARGDRHLKLSAVRTEIDNVGEFFRSARADNGGGEIHCRPR